MLFNSYGFILLFLPITFFVYFFLNRMKLTFFSRAWLVGASLFFYGWWNIKYVPLILGSILFNYAVGATLERMNREGAGNRESAKKTACIVGILGNVALLAYFKYADFFIDNVNYLFGAQFSLIHIILPLGISFFTFTQIAFIVDAYKGVVREYDLLNYALFVTFFPHLLAGPIIHHKEMMPQFKRLRNKIINNRNISLGLFLFTVGLMKKVVIADTLAPWADNGFDQAQALTFFEAWVATLSYTLQIYFDFSGYTDMALGSALLFNIKLPINFDSPYKSLDIQEFWRRWHITLGRFLREYVYIPMGGNRGETLRTYGNLMATFFIGGFWHGAGWTFVVWGLLHGSAMVVHSAWKRFGMSLPKPLAWFLTFNFINITWVFFRAKSFNDASKILKSMFGFGEIRLPEFLSTKLAFLANRGIKFGDDLRALGDSDYVLRTVLVCLLIVLLAANTNKIAKKFKADWKSAVFVGAMATYCIFDLSKVTKFIYFQF